MWAAIDSEVWDHIDVVNWCCAYIQLLSSIVDLFDWSQVFLMFCVHHVWQTVAVFYMLCYTDITTLCPEKRCHFIFDYNSRISWSIIIFFAPVETRMNTPQSYVISLLNSLMMSYLWHVANDDSLTLFYVLK